MRKAVTEIIFLGLEYVQICHRWRISERYKKSSMREADIENLSWVMIMFTF